MTKNILGISGSLRAGSLNTALLHATLDQLGDAATTSVADISTLPLYNSDLDGDARPEPVNQLRRQIELADALIIATPEYNYSIPGGLKNAIDWASRPAYRSPLANKPTAILGASMSPVGTARAQAHLRQILAGTVTPIFPHPEFLAGRAHDKFDSDGVLVDEETQRYLARFVDDFLTWLHRLG